MDRRDFIKQTGVAAVTASISATAAQAAAAPPAKPSLASGIRELRVATPWLRNGRGFDDSARRLAASISTLSSGRLVLAFQPSETGLEALTRGDADIFHGSGRDFVSLDRSFALFAGLPGKAALRPTYHNAWLTAAGGQTLWDDLSAQHGFRPFFAGHAGARAKLWSRTPITSLDDLIGLRIAASGLSADVAATLGATPVQLPARDIAAAMASGTVDAVEWGATIAGYACDLHQSAHHCYAPGLSRSGFTSVLAIRSDVWDQLSASDQAIIAAAVSQELNTVVAESLSVSHQLRLSLAERHGITFGAMPADIVAASHVAAAQAVETLVAESPSAARIHASYMAFRDRLPRHKRKLSTETPVA